MEAINEQLITSFLLGDLSDKERQKIEERVFLDDSFYAQVLALQEELADDYVQNKQSPGKRAQFEKYFLQSPRRRERVEFAAAISGALAPSELGTTAPIAPPIPSWWESVLAFVRPRLVLATSLATLLILLLGGSWLYLQNRRLSEYVAQALKEKDLSMRQSQAREIQAAEQRQRVEGELAALRAQSGELQSQVQQKERELETLQRTRPAVQAQPAASFLASFTLLPGLTRESSESNEPEKLIVPAAARFIQLRLVLGQEEDYQGYLAEIRTARGNLVWSTTGLVSRRTTAGPTVSLTLPRKFLTNGEYEVTLKGAAGGKFETIGYYYIIALNR
jgi:hypothetical protein